MGVIGWFRDKLQSRRGYNVPDAPTERERREERVKRAAPSKMSALIHLMDEPSEIEVAAQERAEANRKKYGIRRPHGWYPLKREGDFRVATDGTVYLRRPWGQLIKTGVRA